MNKALYDSIYTFSEDHEIDYQGLMEVAKRNGKTIINEAALCEFKNAVDKFLRSNSEQDLLIVERFLNEGKKPSKCPDCGSKDIFINDDSSEEDEDSFGEYVCNDCGWVMYQDDEDHLLDTCKICGKVCPGQGICDDCMKKYRK